MGRIVVTGGAGFLGSHLTEALLARGDEVIAIDNLLTGTVDNISHLFGHKGFVFVEHDVTNFVHVSGPVDAVLHLASPASPVDYLEHPIKTLKVGSLGTHKTLGLAKDKGARFFLASTSEVYGDPQVHPQTEDYWGHVNPIGPRGVYDEAKRFAEAMTLAYHRSHGVDTRIVRIFNSILADEQVLYDDGLELRREPVEAAAARLEPIDGACRVPSADGDGVVRLGETSALVSHPPTGPCYEVRTRYGRSVRVTGDHSVFVEGADGRPAAKRVTDLAVGDRIAIFARVSVPERDRTVVRMSEAWGVAGCDPWRLMVHAPGLGERAWERRQELFAACAAERPSNAKKPRAAIWSRISQFRRRDELPLAGLRKLGEPVPDGAMTRVRNGGPLVRMPEHVKVTDELLWMLGVLVAEGSLHKKPPKSYVATISCSEDVLDRAQKILERDLNLHVVRAGRTTARAGAIFVHSQLFLAFLEALGFDGGDKRIPGWILGLPLSRLKWFLEGYREGDGVHSGAKFLEGRRHEFSTTSEALKDDLVVALGRFGLVPSVGRYETTLRQRTGDRRYPFWRLTLCHVTPWSPLDWDAGVAQRLNARRTGDLVWAMVTSIEEVEPTRLVYDFCVPDLENFWAGGVLCHNTYGPRMRRRDGRVVSNFLTQAIEGRPITVYGDGSQTRSFCYVDDEIAGLLALLDSDYVGPVNIGNPNEFTVLELAELVIELTGSSSEIIFEDLPIDDPKQRKPDISLALRVLGWEPKISLREGLTRTAAWFART